VYLIQAADANDLAEHFPDAAPRRHPGRTT
jgi:hypothetical protein